MMVSTPLRPIADESELDAVGGGTEEESEDELVDGELQGEEGIRMKLDKEEDVIKTIGDPSLPKEADVKKHYVMGHIPYRSWCHICVKAQGKEMPHLKGLKGERQLSEYAWDYCFPGDEYGYKWTVLIGKEKRSQAWMAATVPSKGGTGKFGVDKCLDFIEENGDREGDIIVKNDQEVSMQYLIKDLLVERAAGKTVLEESPVKSSSSNGMVERGV